MKNIFKFKNIAVLLTGLIVGTIGYTTASSVINANQVGYNKGERQINADNVQDAIDKLFEHAENYCPKKVSYSITNVIENGDFEDGITGWYAGNNASEIGISTENSYYGSKSLFIKLNGSRNESTAKIDNTLKSIGKFYCSAMYLSPDSGVEILNLGLGNYHTGSNISTTWQKISLLVDYNVQTESTIALRLDNNHMGNASSVSYFDGVLCVDLTKAFGAGNEPTKEWCDENISYFEGVTTVYK